MSRATVWLKAKWQQSNRSRALLLAPPMVLLLGGWWLVSVVRRPAVQYYTAKAEKGDVAQVVQATGTINAVTTVQVGSQVSGNIAQLFADFNSHVEKDQIVAQIDPSTFRARLMQAEADTENAVANVKGLEAQIETQRADVLACKAGVDKAQAQLNDARLNMERTRDLFGQGIVSAAQRDTAQSGYEAGAASKKVAEAQYAQSEAKLKSTIAQLDQARAQVSQKRAAAEMARLDLAHTTIRAPISGTVIARNVDVGQTVAASLQAPVLFVIAQDLTKMLVYAKTDEADVGKIQVGATADFRVDSFPREKFSGRVKQVRMNASTIQNVVTYDSIIEFGNPEQKLFPGMTAYVTIPVAWDSEVVKIPNGALRFRPEVSDEERRKLFAKYNIPEEPRAGPGARLAAGGAAGGSAGPGGPAGPARGSRPNRSGRQAGTGTPTDTPAEATAPGATSQRDDWGIVWKLLPNKELQPMRVKLGVTDFTFTAMKAGDVKPGDELVIGQTTKNGGAQQAGAGQRPGGPMGGPGGMPRKM